jgi:lipoprotein-releasing system permease protein
MIFGPFERMVAGRYLRARRREGFISIIAWFSLLGIALGVATLIIVMSVMNGFHEQLLNRILGLNGHVGIYAPPGGMTDFDALADKVRKIPGVTLVTPVVEQQVFVTTAGGASSGALVRGVRPEDILQHSAVGRGITAGNPADFGADDTVLIGDRLAQKLGVGPGDKFDVVSFSTNATAFGNVPRMRTYRVAAIFDVGMYEYDSTFIYMPLSAAQIHFKLPDRVTDLQVSLADLDQVQQASRMIRQVVGPDLRIYDFQHASAAFFAAVTTERNVMFLILTLIILVAAFNVISSLIMLVKDKARDIAILRTMGATRGMIMRIFFLSGAAVGIIGTAGGVALGLAFALNIESIRQFLQRFTGTDLFNAEIYFLSQLPAKVDTGEVILVAGMALGLSFLATIYPSWRAAKLDPVEALRYE